MPIDVNFDDSLKRHDSPFKEKEHSPLKLNSLPEISEENIEIASQGGHSAQQDTEPNHETEPNHLTLEEVKESE
jgi:hypothetical protein